MSNAITVRGFLGDRERDFTLTSPMLAELERKTGFGILELFGRIGRQAFTAAELTEIIRFALVGAGTEPVEAQRLVGLYVEDRPIMETVSLAFAILDVRINGREPAKPAPAPAVEPQPEPPVAPALEVDHALSIGSD